MTFLVCVASPQIGNQSLKSDAYNWDPKAICLSPEMHWVRLAFSLALARAGSSIAARMAIIAITTSNSISVKAGGGPSLVSLGWWGWVVLIRLSMTILTLVYLSSSMNFCGNKLNFLATRHWERGILAGDV